MSNDEVGYKACWKLLAKGRCRAPDGHDGEHWPVWSDTDRKHRWKLSWPGNFCLDCGYDDPNENTDVSLINCDCTSPDDCLKCGGTGCQLNPNMVWEPCPGPPMILFLDFDGVLHPMIAGGPDKLFEQSQKIRELMIKYPCLHLVIHSSWRMCSAYSEEDLWDFLEIEDSLRHRYLGVTPVTEPSRWESIQAWMKARPYKGAYVILDDMHNSFDYEGQDHLICPPYDTGMRDEDWKELERRINAHLQP
jgi:hypothetical protein